MRQSLALTAMTALALLLAGCAAPVGDGLVASASPSPSASPVAPATVQGEPVPTHDTSVESLLAKRPIPPVQVSIDAIDLSMPIEPVGVEPDGAMELILSAQVAGWYRHGASPSSETGNIVIAAHVDDARQGLGPFHRLGQLSEGDVIQVTLDDGAIASYAVTKLEQSSKQDVDMDVVFAKTDVQRLVLVTCGGRWNPNTRHYEDNVVVWAEPVGDAP